MVSQLPGLPFPCGAGEKVVEGSGLAGHQLTGCRPRPACGPWLAPSPHPSEAPRRWSRCRCHSFYEGDIIRIQCRHFAGSNECILEASSSYSLLSLVIVIIWVTAGLFMAVLWHTVSASAHHFAIKDAGVISPRNPINY